MTERIYIRIRGVVKGPYDNRALQELVRRGILSRIHEVSLDGVAWKAATDFGYLFASATPIPSDESERESERSESYAEREFVTHEASPSFGRSPPHSTDAIRPSGADAHDWTLASEASQEDDRKYSGWAVASLALGIVWICGIGSVGAVYCAWRAKRQFRRSHSRPKGSLLASVGLWLGILGVAVALMLAVVAVYEQFFF